MGASLTSKELNEFMKEADKVIHKAYFAAFTALMTILWQRWVVVTYVPVSSFLKYFLKHLSKQTNKAH